MVQIRRAVSRDADAIAKMAAEAAAEEGGASGLDVDRIKSHAFAGNPLFEAWVALERPNAPPIGQAVITKSYDFRRAAPTVVLCELYVVPAQRRSGLARKLMSCVARRARDLGARELSITTGVENAVAQKFFAAVGARPRQDASFMMSADGIEWLAAEKPVTLGARARQARVTTKGIGMLAKSLLKTAAAWVVIAAMTACATATTPTGAAPASAQAAPTLAEAQQFVTDAERELVAMSENENRIGWVYSTYMDYDTEWLSQRADSMGTQARVRLASQAARFQALQLPPELRRKIDLIRLSLTLPAPQREGAADQLAAINSRLASRYSTSKVDYQGHQVTLDELETMMGTERNPARLQEMWTKWHNIAGPMASDYAQMVQIANEGARDLGYPNVGDYWLSNYDMPPEQMEREVERLWGQMQPFYEQLHCYVRQRLNAHYGSSVQPASGLIRADLLGNMWAQEWGNISDIVGPATRGGYNLTRLLQQQHYDAVRLTRTGERFYTSLGLAPLPETFWERSQLVRPRDRDVVCHASAWDLDARDDVRIKMCITVNADDFQTVHHELGHNYYQRAYQNQPILFQNGANDGFHEAIGDFIALNTTPDYLVQIGLLRQNQAPPAAADNALLMRQALDKIAFLPFAISVDQWRWRVFRGQIQPADYNTAWWRLRQHYQGITPPGGPRPADAFDPGAKYHVANNVPYLRYFLARVLQFQFYEAACRQAGWQGPLHRCTVYGNHEVGQRLNAMLEMGQSHPWPDALEAFAGTRQMDGSAMVHYFQPLMSYMQQQNRGQQCGWDGENE